MVFWWPRSAANNLAFVTAGNAGRFAWQSLRPALLNLHRCTVRRPGRWLAEAHDGRALRQRFTVAGGAERPEQRIA
jgi:hypothetical protein